MKELIIASNNNGKIAEITALLSDVQLLSLADIGFTEEIPEPFETFEQNALAKAQTIHGFSDKNVFADDSGLCVNALNGAPGVHSAYFGGLPRADEKNNQKLLRSLSDETNRTAFYKAVTCLIWNDAVYFFEGICEGTILTEPRGSHGFGYDPLFVPEGFSQSFAEMDLKVKNEISHRAKAVKKMISFLKSQMEES